MTQLVEVKNRNGKKKMVPRGFKLFGNPYPLFADVTFKYVDRITIDALGSGAVGLYLFACNGMYDPDITGTGHQPLGFDQWLGTSTTTGFYNHYLVVKSVITVTAFSQAADGTGQSVILLGISDDTTTNTDFNALAENPSYKSVRLGSIGSGHDVVTIKHTYNACKNFGVTPESLYTKEDLMGSYGANPSELSYFNLVTSSNNITVNPANVAFLVEIEFHAHLTERKEQLGS